MNEPRPDIQEPKPASLFRRFGAIFYDTLLLMALWMVGTALTLFLTHGKAVQPNNPFFQTYLLFIAFMFYAGFWTYGGQTLGMRAWRLRVVRGDGSGISLWQALLRFLTVLPAWIALGGGLYLLYRSTHPALALLPWGGLVLAYLASRLDRRRRTWYDIYSETRLVVLPKRAKARSPDTADADKAQHAK